MAQDRKQPGKPQVLRLPLIGAYTNRGDSPLKDQRFVNMFPETRKVEQIENTKIYVNKRPGLTQHRSYGAGEGRNCTYFNGKFYVAVGDKVYEDAASPVLKITLTGSTGQVGMLVANSASLGNYLFICDGTAGWIINTAGTVTAISDPDFPTPHIPTPVFIDGYIILSKGIDAYNCDLDTPTSWTSSNYLSAEMFPDAIAGLSRQNNQVCALGTSSIEFFYDAANSAGSPLSRNDSTTIQMGTCSPYAVIGNEKYIFYLSQSDSGGRGAWLVEGFQPKKVSDEYIDRILDGESNIAGVHGFGVRTKGHLFYVMNLPGSNRTLVYDSDEKLWHEWSSYDTGSHSVFKCSAVADNGTGSAYLLHSSNGILYKLDTSNYRDDTDPILVELVTNKYDMDTYNRKFQSSLKIIGDRYETSNIVNMQFSDNDYESWSNLKPIDLNDDFPAFHRLGSFRRRAYKFTHALNQPLRLESIEVVFTEGNS